MIFPVGSVKAMLQRFTADDPLTRLKFGGYTPISGKFGMGGYTVNDPLTRIKLGGYTPGGYSDKYMGGFTADEETSQIMPKVIQSTSEELPSIKPAKVKKVAKVTKIEPELSQTDIIKSQIPIYRKIQRNLNLSEQQLSDMILGAGGKVREMFGKGQTPQQIIQEIEQPQMQGYEYDPDNPWDIKAGGELLDKFTVTKEGKIYPVNKYQMHAQSIPKDIPLDETYRVIQSGKHAWLRPGGSSEMIKRIQSTVGPERDRLVNALNKQQRDWARKFYADSGKTIITMSGMGGYNRPIEAGADIPENIESVIDPKYILRTKIPRFNVPLEIKSRHIPEINELFSSKTVSAEEKQEFTDLYGGKIIQTLANNMGVMAKILPHGSGIFQGELSPNISVMVEGGKENAQALGLMYGMIVPQDAVGGFEVRQRGEHIGATIELPKGYTAKQLQNFSKKTGLDGTVVGDDFVFIDFENKHSPQELQVIVNEGIRDSFKTDAKYDIIEGSGFYAENDWKESPYGESYKNVPGRAGEILRANEGKVRSILTPILEEARREAGRISKFKNVSQYLTESELKTPLGKPIGKNLQSEIVDIFEHLPEDVEFREAALAGEAKRGWYTRASSILKDLFGEHAQQFVALLSATSPQQSVRNNLLMTLRVWNEWLDAGKPTSGSVLENILAKTDLPARIQNARRVLQGDYALSGYKVDSFARNLMGDLNAVTNDTWMSKFGDISQQLFGTKKGYLAFTAKTRKIAKQIGWQPAEVQETIWSFMMAMTRKAVGGKTYQQAAQEVTEEDIKKIPEFYDLILEDKDVQSELRRIGVDPAFFGGEREVVQKFGTQLPGKKEPRKNVLARIGQRFDILESVGLPEQKL